MFSFIISDPLEDIEKLPTEIKSQRRCAQSLDTVGDKAITARTSLSTLNSSENPFQRLAH